MRVAIDETAAEPGALAAERRRRGVPEGLALRRDRGPARAAALVRAAGAEAYLASTFDGPLGIAAALHAAAALARRTAAAAGWRRWRCSRASRTRCRADGAIAVPAGPGLGV